MVAEDMAHLALLARALAWRAVVIAEMKFREDVGIVHADPRAGDIFVGGNVSVACS